MTLFITAKESWKMLSDDAQRENLKNLLAHPAKEKLKNVVLTDGKGSFLGGVSDDGVRMDGQSAKADEIEISD